MLVQSLAPIMQGKGLILRMDWKNSAAGGIEDAGSLGAGSAATGSGRWQVGAAFLQAGFGASRTDEPCGGTEAAACRAGRLGERVRRGGFFADAGMQAGLHHAANPVLNRAAGG